MFGENSGRKYVNQYRKSMAEYSIKFMCLMCKQKRETSSKHSTDKMMEYESVQKGNKCVREYIRAHMRRIMDGCVEEPLEESVGRNLERMFIKEKVQENKRENMDNV